MATFRSKQENQISGFSSLYNKTIEVNAEGLETAEPVVTAAKTGALTVRTNATDGSLTIAGGHGIATANKFDLFWAGGARHGVLAGTVATNVVPFSGGTGDDLPAAATAITAHKGTDQDLAVETGSNAKAITAYSSIPTYVSFRDNSDVELFSVRLVDPTGLLGDSYSWYSGSGVANPLDAVTVDHVKCTHGRSTGTNKPQVAVIFD